MRKIKSLELLGFFKKVIFILLIVIGLVLIFNKPIRNIIIGWNSNNYQVNNISKKTIEKNKSADVSFDFGSVQPVSTESVLAAQWKAQQLPVIGGVAIPDVGINLPIFKGLGNTELTYGAGTMKEDQVMGGENNYTLASHHVFGLMGASSMLFSPLDKAKSGMKIYITDKTTIYTYVITNIEVITPDHSEVLNNHKGISEITLVTCEDAGATYRTIVHGTLESSIPYGNASKNIRNAFNTSYNQIAL